VIRHLHQKGLPVALSAAPAPKELDYIAGLRNGLEVPVIDLSGKLDLPLLAALIEQARIFFGVDSAPMHMAAALGAPTAVIFGPSGEKMWGPWQVECEVITGACDERPCGRDGCDGGKVSRCLEELAPEPVIAAIDRLLART